MKAESHTCQQILLLQGSLLRNVLRMLLNGLPLYNPFLRKLRRRDVHIHRRCLRNLTTGETCISVWSTYYETSCRIDKELCLIVNHILWKNWIKYIFLDVLMDLLLGNILVVLC